MKSPAFSFYVRDWLCSNKVSKLHSKSYSKDGSNKHSRCLNAYLFLLIQSWLQEPIGTLPDDDQELSELARVTPQEWDAIKSDIRPCFKVGNDGRLFNERLMAEVLKQLNRIKAGSIGGSKKQANRVAALEIENEQEGEIYSSNSRVALHYLNEQTGKKFRESETSLAPIHARLKESGVDIEGVKLMISRQCKRWMGTPQEEYLTPTTLFGKEKFGNYYASKDLPINENNTKHNPQRIDRSIGTANEGKAALYRGLGKLAKPESAQ